MSPCKIVPLSDCFFLTGGAGEGERQRVDC
jgi:hypothetical protein